MRSHRGDVGLPSTGRFAELPGPVAIGPAELDGLTAYPIPDSAWRDFGDWGGIRVDALVSWGFLRHFSWTIDFDRRRYLFGDAQDRPAWSPTGAPARCPSSPQSHGLALASGDEPPDWSDAATRSGTSSPSA